jgi:hypothetical protein
MGARLEHTPRKLLKRLAQDTGVSKPSARTQNNCRSLPVKVGVSSALSGRRIVVRAFFLTKQLIAKNIYM